jgi:hypothetical protein
LFNSPSSMLVTFVSSFVTFVIVTGALMDLGLTDKVALITGSSRGLGFASAVALAAEGCR